MKTLNGILFLCALFLISGCIPDSFTKWNLEPPSADSSTDSGSTPGSPSGSTTPPPTSFAYNPPGPYQFNITTDASATISDLIPVSTGGGEIVVGNITFQLAQVRDINGIATTTVWPNTLSLDPTTGIISGRPNQFVNHNTYTINATPLGAVTPIQTQIVISMATRPGTIFYPQLNGRTLLLEISAPQNFKVGNYVTSEKNAKGTVTTVDEKNKNIYITVNCTPPSGQTYCPTFNPGDKIDNKNGYFLEQSIVNKVVYGFTTTTGIPTNWNWIPITNPNVSGEQPQYAISPDITVNQGVHFSTTTGQIWTDVPLPAPIPNTNYTVTVKNVISQTANAIFNMQILGVSDPRSPDSVEYAYVPGSRVVLELTDNSQFLVGGKISNQDGTSGTIKGILVSGASTQLLIDIDPWSVSDFQANQPVDNGYPYVLQATTIANKTPIFVHQIGQSFNFPPTLSGNLSPSDLDTLSWTSDPELPHLCQSIASTPTVYYKENTNEPNIPTSCENAHGTCSIATITNGFECVNPPNAGTWTTNAKYLTEYANELWFNRRTGKFGAWNPQKTFPGQTFNVSVTSLTGVVLNTTTAISFEGVPQNLSYAGDVLLEVDDDSAFDIGDMITTDGNGVGIITHKFISLPPPGTPTYTPTGKILVVKASSGVFLEGEDIDNVYPFTFQKGEIIQAKYNDLGIQVGNIIGFVIGEEVSSASATGIINYIQDPASNPTYTEGILWARLINTQNPPTSFTTVGNPTINSVTGTAITTVTGIIGDNVTIAQNGATTFSPGLDVSSNFGPNGGFGMANSVSGFNVSVSVESGRFYKDTAAPKPLFRYNPPNTTAAGQTSSLINDITHNPIFYLDRHGTSGIQSVIVSPPNNGVVYSIKPLLPEGLSFDTATGEISVVAPGPVAAALKNYTVVASNFLGETSFTFGLAVREVFSITDITNTNGNISGIMHKSGQGYSRFPCRITQDQIKSQATGNSRGKNINCLYDVGEGDLFNNGLVVQVNVGSNLCVYVAHVPYFFYQNQYIQTTPNPASPTVESTGQYNNVLCGPGQPNGTIAQYPNGDPESQCLGNLGGTQCDDGSVSTIQRNYTLQGICYNSSVTPTNPVPGVTDFTTCFGEPNLNGSTQGQESTNPTINRSYCSNNTAVNRTDCLNANQAWNSNYAFINGDCWFIQPETDAVACSDNYGTCTGGTGGTNRSLCIAGGGVWNTTGLFVTNANCFSTAGVPGPDFPCGGSQLNCINGPAKDDSDFPQSQLTGRFDTYIRGYTVPVGTDPIPFTYASPLSKNYQSNIYLSNFSRQLNASAGNACTPFNNNIYEYDMSTWFNVGFNLSPITNGADSPFSGGNGVYSIRCLDASANIIGQINLLIREWDHNFKAKDGVDIMDYTGNPVDAGNATDPDFGNPLNAYEDWDDKSIGGTCAAPTYDFPGGNL